MPATSSATRSRVEPAAGDVIQEEQRARPLHQDVVDAVVDDVVAELVSCRRRGGGASFTLVPTPSVEATSTGWLHVL